MILNMETYNENSCYHQTSFLDEKGRLRTVKVPVVQELARQGLKHLPDRFKRPDSTAFAHHVFEEIPSVNLATLKEGSESMVRAEELAKLADAARGLGVFLIVDHGVPLEVVDGARDVVKSFFKLPFPEKKACVGTYSEIDNMGYGRNFVKSEDQALDWIDRLTFRVAPPLEDDEGLRVWPLKPTNFREAMERYAREARGVMDFLLVALAEALSIESHDVFLKYFHPTDSEIKARVNYYPPCPSPELAMGLNQHSDASALTILAQFGSSQGLQVLNKDQTWITISWPQDQLLVVVGDLLEIMSNGLVHSTWHRAITNRSAERGSIALFYSPPPRTLIEPVAAEEETYGEVVVEDYLRHYYKVVPTMEKIAINFAKVN
ncbi:S-norcoclaurine synthase 1 [Neltuma alba]|uniref:S-norcoclaurine synthase 1 n=1 Tax=Neltuma alba TaxID=207710 RepID=UPI0010A443E9|nr:S-norcoclaurine synthase 1-like [Prosopis alba]XP_028770432.1 S-norcoclaurine synthase 1-like [Prosopis alba]XP_028786745.1 S-norcoclaurine synthase 1-like [Prosopis alba]XP_028786746.1 S-norcoclaurine synthase 1-like [Prosopis alba]